MESLKEPLNEHFSTIELDQYIDGELSSLDDHLSKCIDCRCVLRDRQTLILRIDRAFGDSIALPSNFASSVAEAAFNRPTIFGRKIFSLSELIVLWFMVAAALNSTNPLFGSISASVSANNLMPSIFTESGALVRITHFAAEAAVQGFARFLSAM